MKKYNTGQYYYIRYSTGEQYIALAQKTDECIRGPRLSIKDGSYNSGVRSFSFIESREARWEEIQYFENCFKKRPIPFTTYIKEIETYPYTIY